MGGQQALPGLEDERPDGDLYLAIHPLPEVAERMAGLTSELGRSRDISGKPFAACRLHFSMQTVGQYTASPD